MTEQTWNPDEYARNARFVADLATDVVSLLAPHAGERILDLGCGDGALTAKLSQLGCEMYGVDASAAQVDATKKLGIDAQQVDGHELAFKNEFDAAFSNAALHWMSQPDLVIAGVRRSLRDGGRFVGEFGGAGCIATVIRALRDALVRRGLSFDALNPWYFPTDVEYAERLRVGGFTVRSCGLYQRPTQLPGEAVEWLKTFAQSFFTALPPDEHVDFLHEVQEQLRPQLCDAKGVWTLDYVRLRFRAELTGEITR